MDFGSKEPTIPVSRLPEIPGASLSLSSNLTFKIHFLRGKGME